MSSSCYEPQLSFALVRDRTFLHQVSWPRGRNPIVTITHRYVVEVVPRTISGCHSVRSGDIAGLRAVGLWVSDVSVLHNLPINRGISQIPQCIWQISHDAPFCNRNVHTCAHFCCKWCIVVYKNGTLCGLLDGSIGQIGRWSIATTRSLWVSSVYHCCHLSYLWYNN